MSERFLWRKSWLCGQSRCMFSGKVRHRPRADSPRVSPSVCGFHAPADNESSQRFVPTTARHCQTRVSQFFPMMYMVNPCFFINRSFVTRRGLRAVFQPSSTFSKFYWAAQKWEKKTEEKRKKRKKKKIKKTKTNKKQKNWVHQSTNWN